jgi:hypothetical protein
MNVNVQRIPRTSAVSAGDGHINLLLYLTIITAFFADFRDDRFSLGAIKTALVLAPEALSGLLLVALLLRLGKTKQLFLSPKYIVIGGLIMLHMFLGLILSDGTSGTAVAGIRDYFKFVPLFLLPAVVELPERTVRNCLTLLVALCLLQFPLSVYQRVVIFPVIPTGDVVRGTFDSGANVSMVMVGAIAVMVAFWIRHQLSLRTLVIVSSVLISPTLFNETKATIVIFALAMMTIAVYSSSGRKRIAAITGTGALVVLFVLASAAAYDYFYPDQFGGMGFLNFYADRAIDNEYRGINHPSETREIPRIDTIVLGYREISKDPSLWAFGHGIGNVSHPNRPRVIAGAHNELYDLYRVSRTTYTQLLWETGVVGLLLLGAWLTALLFDSRSLSRQPGFNGALGLAWSVVITVLPLMLLYKSIVHASALVVILTFLSGVVVARVSRDNLPRHRIHPARARRPGIKSEMAPVAGMKRRAY